MTNTAIKPNIEARDRVRMFGTDYLGTVIRRTDEEALVKWDDYKTAGPVWHRFGDFELISKS